MQQPPPIPQGVWDCLGEGDRLMAMTALPDSLTNKHAACLARAAADLAPPTPDQIDAVIVSLAGKPMQAKTGVDAAALDAGFHIGLDDVPADLLELGLYRAWKRLTFRPQPNEFVELIADELAARRRRLARLGG